MMRARNKAHARQARGARAANDKKVPDRVGSGFSRRCAVLAILLARLATAGTLAGMTARDRGDTKMRHYRKALWQRMILSLFVGALPLSGARTIQAEGSANERALWKLEQDYWRYVQENDLAAYSTLWHERFLGWPSVSPVPVHKDHITDWITAQTSKGLKFISVDFKPAAIQVTGDVAVYFIFYNFCRIHQTLRVTPAIEAGVSDHIWSLDEIIGLLGV